MQQSQSPLFHTHWFTCTAGGVSPDVDNQRISVTERVVDHEGIGPRFSPRSPERTAGTFRVLLSIYTRLYGQGCSL